MQRLYFGHPVNTYNTALERQLLLAINKAFPNCIIENPNTKKHQQKYGCRKKKTGNGMHYFTEEVLPLCAGGIFLAFRDRMFSAGVMAEARFFIERGNPTWEILSNGNISPLKPPYENRVLSVEETRIRIRDISGKTIPY